MFYRRISNVRTSLESVDIFLKSWTFLRRDILGKKLIIYKNLGTFLEHENIFVGTSLIIRTILGHLDSEDILKKWHFLGSAAIFED